MTDCAYCGEPTARPHREHVVPLSRGGPDDPTNIVLACASCNLSKGARLPSEWRSNLPELVLAIETSVCARVANTDKRVRNRRPQQALAFQCGVCGGIAATVRGHSTGMHTYEGDDGGPDVVLSAVRIYWWRSVENGAVTDIRLAIGNCGEFTATEEGLFSCGIDDIERLSDITLELEWENQHHFDLAAEMLQELRPLSESAKQARLRRCTVKGRALSVEEAASMVRRAIGMSPPG